MIYGNCGVRHRDTTRAVEPLRAEGGGPGGDAARREISASLAVLVPVVLSGVLLVALVPGLWWVFTTYGWVAFPALGTLARGIAGTYGGGAVTAGTRERELLEALRRNGTLTPARAALETSLSVAEADRLLRELAGNGHLEVSVRDGGIFYALWRGEVARGGATR